MTGIGGTDTTKRPVLSNLALPLPPVSTTSQSNPPSLSLQLQTYYEDPLSLDWDTVESPVKVTASSMATHHITIPKGRVDAPQKTPTLPLTEEAMSGDLRNAYDRDASPPLALSPSLTLDACPQLDRSVSTASSISSSRRSSSSRLSDPNLPSSKRRGYMRPQVTNYSESAKNRESVMSLGSIAHLQYYFARTGLLDGKGAQVARPEMLRRKSSNIGSRSASTSHAESPAGAEGQGLQGGGLLSPTTMPDSYAISDGGLTDSPTEQSEDVDWDSEAMLPPTVSTYNQKPIYVAPPPDLTMLRRELTEALEDALKVLKETDKSPDGNDSPGWYEIQGLHLLDIITLAIRAARNYYTAHTRPQRLYQFKSEREIRNDLYKTLEILKRMASRNFSGGIRQSEKVEILTWIVGISELIQSEIDQEKSEQEEREKFRWRQGDWTGREREREELFLRSFMETGPEEMPKWTEPGDVHAAAELPTPFLKFFQNGLQLVMLHNTLVRRSKRHFEEIRAWHTDTAKPYRQAENLRYWIKAAQLRWEVVLEVDVMGVVHGEDPKAWVKFDEAIGKWCKAVREELTGEWVESQRSEGRGGGGGRKTPPTLKVEVGTPEREGERKRSNASTVVMAGELTPVEAS